MKKVINVTSNNQNGGSTVGEINVGSEKRKRRLWPYVVGIAAIISAVIAVLTYFNITIWINQSLM